MFREYRFIYMCAFVGYVFSWRVFVFSLYEEGGGEGIVADGSEGEKLF